MGYLLQLKVEIKHTSPTIWRRIVVEDSASFYQLHHIIQIAFGWENSHLYEFRAGDLLLANPELMDEDEVTDDKTISLSQVFSAEGDQVKYTYDFGDYWEHLITFEQTSDLSYYPICLGGEWNGPPEDCGGIPGYEHLLKMMNDKGYVDLQTVFNDHERSRFFPDLVELDKINSQLYKLQEYIEEYESGF